MSAKLHAPQLSTFRQRMDARFPPWIGFCHNDLQYGNLLLFGCGAGGAPAGSGPAAGGGSGSGAAEDAPARGAAVGCIEGGGNLWVTLIDYEYSTLNGKRRALNARCFVGACSALSCPGERLWCIHAVAGLNIVTRRCHAVLRAPLPAPSLRLQMWRLMLQTSSASGPSTITQVRHLHTQHCLRFALPRARRCVCRNTRAEVRGKAAGASRWRLPLFGWVLRGD